jgi:hypothetical protein
MNAVGNRTLEYLRGEKDLLEERKQIAEVKKTVEALNLSYWTTGMSKRRVERFWKIVSLLQENSRMSLAEMSRNLKVPISTLFDTLKEVEKIFRFTIVLKDNKQNVLLNDTVPVECSNQGLRDGGEKNERISEPTSQARG